MRVAFAVWKGRISPVFDVSRQILVLSVENGSIAGTHCETFANDDPVYRASRLAALGISTLICGAVSRPLADMLAAQGIQTIPFTAGETDAVIAAYLADALPNPGMSMPGCGTRRRHCRQNLSEKYNILHREQRGGGMMPNADGTGPGKGPARVREAAEPANRAAAVRAVRLRAPDAEADRAGNKVRVPDAAGTKVRKEAAVPEIPQADNLNFAAAGRAECGELLPDLPALLSHLFMMRGGNTMPRGNGTGPAGMGPMTGWGAGYCSGYGMPGYGNPGQRSGLRTGAGQMRGWRRGCGRRSVYDSPVSPGRRAMTSFTMPASEDENRFCKDRPMFCRAA